MLLKHASQTGFKVSKIVSSVFLAVREETKAACFCMFSWLLKNQKQNLKELYCQACLHTQGICLVRSFQYRVYNKFKYSTDISRQYEHKQITVVIKNKEKLINVCGCEALSSVFCASLFHNIRQRAYLQLTCFLGSNSYLICENGFFYIWSHKCVSPE